MQKTIERHLIIRKILMEDWDPIGVANIEGTEDEYDGYIADLQSLLDKNATLGDIADYLYQIETEHMGLSGSKDHAKSVAEKLIISMS